MPIKNIIKDDSVLASQVREFIKEKGSPSRMIVKRDVVRLPGNPRKRIEVQTEKTNAKLFDEKLQDGSCYSPA